jgi:RES domain
MPGLTTRRQGRLLRVCDPDWQDPLDDSYSRATGGRWNPLGEFGMVYLCADDRTARANVADKFAGLPYGPEDLDEDEAPELALVDAPAGDYRDCVSDKGLEAVGLPVSYPDDECGRRVGWDVCQPTGRDSHAEALGGVAARSAAIAAQPGDEEVAHINREGAPPLELADRLSFSEWFWTPEPLTEGPG